MTSNHIVNSRAIELLVSNSTVCESPNMNGVHRTTENGDHVRQMVEESVRSSPKSTLVDCQKWIDEPSFLFQGDNVHIYFKFLAWYNAYKSILDQGKISSYRVFRIAKSSFKYLFGDYEKLLFPGIEFVQDMTEETVCFKKLVLPPGCFASTFFRCKMEFNVRGKCFNCRGNGRPGTTIRSFQAQALQACSIDDHSITTDGYRHPEKIVVILRKQYIRHPADKPGSFNRVISNSAALLAELKNKITPNVISFSGEDLPVCEQIRIVHSADIFIGVHGAGLVHSWWLRDNALLFEIVPSDQVSNPTFKMLTTLAGLSYKGFTIRQGSVAAINLDIKGVVDTLKRTIQNGV